MENDELIKVIQTGKSHNRTVEIVKKSSTSKFYIMKSLNIHSYSQEKLLDSLTEIHILKNLKSPYIIKFKDFFIEKDLLCIVMQFACGGDLNERVQTQKKIKKTMFSENQILDWMTQLALGLYYLHEKNVIHCDIKLENVFLTAYGDVKIGDFGIAKILEKSDDSVKTCFGTPYYMSPELCEKQVFSKESDVWSMGCVLYYLLTLSPPFDGENLEDLAYNIKFNKFNESLLKSYSGKVQNLVTAMLQKQKKDRITVAEFLKTDIIYERIERVIKRTQENEINFKINQKDVVWKIISDKFGESAKKFSDTEKEY